MDYYLFSARTLTAAQHMVQTLRSCGITGELQRMPAMLARQGCGFALRISCADAAAAYACLADNSLPSKHIYLRENGIYREVTL